MVTYDTGGFPLLQLKQALVTSPVLATSDFTKTFTVECDASSTGLRAILMQDQRPIAYFSKAISDKNLAKSTYEKEMMALALAIRHWIPYLLGRNLSCMLTRKVYDT